MSGLLPNWTRYTPGTEIPDGFVLYQNTVITLPAFNAMSAQGFFQAPSLMPQPANKTTMPAYLAQRLQSAALKPFARANNNNTAAWIQSAQSKLDQMECPQQFCIAAISICLTHDTGTWCNKLHKEHTDKNWDTFKQDFLARFVLKDTAPMIIRQVKNLTQTGTVKELTRAYKELCLCAPSNMAFDTPAVTVSSIMPGIVHPSKKARKAGKPVSKLTKSKDLNQTVNQKWVTAAPVCQLKPAFPL
ncbi:hypothetical protein DSO57_1024774 [Entomophthora muscae]|uniref:Uncharacterized protein n=1 Tax=Entomophthora muscae TaxID=34485 RepID=A0ACC2SFJ7_9FUNG|nr:hypothetical protein DSO57_1024774 [Entomophthora muscae]